MRCIFPLDRVLYVAVSFTPSMLTRVRRIKRIFPTSEFHSLISGAANQ